MTVDDPEISAKTTDFVFQINLCKNTPELYYYTDVSSAMTAISNSSYNTSENSTFEDAGCAVLIQDGAPRILLMKDASYTTTLNINQPITLDLQGRTLTFTNCTGLNVTAENVIIDGTMSGSKIVVESASVKTTALAPAVLAEFWYQHPRG
jgi:hypothetical protein